MIRRVHAPCTTLRMLLVLILGSTAAGCGGSGGDSASEPPGGLQTYDVRGVLTQLPAERGKELMIRHEAIPDFVGASGDTVGMNPMVMGFPVAEGVPLAALAVGDTVSFTFEVRWSGSPPLRLTRIEALPSGTPLVFRKLQEM